VFPPPRHANSTIRGISRVPPFAVLNGARSDPERLASLRLREAEPMAPGSHILGSPCHVVSYRFRRASARLSDAIRDGRTVARHVWGPRHFCREAHTCSRPPRKIAFREARFKVVPNGGLATLGWAKRD
jgi:hypothetical protein